MRAATIKDGGIVVAEHPDPEPGPGEVLVRVRAAGLNGADVLQRSGKYPAPPGHPQDIPGLEFAGEVVGLGPAAERFAVGDRVTGITGGGGQAELLKVHERQITPAPHGLDWAQVGGFSEVFTTAHDAIITQAGLRPGERLLVHGAAGGVGTAGVQLGHAMGAHVTASVRNQELHNRVAALGADEVVFPELLESQEHDARPFDVVLELVGAPNLGVNVRRLATGGRIVVIGVGGGAKGEVNLFGLMSARGRIMASTLRARPLEEKAAAARRIEREVLPLVARGAITVPVAASYPLDDAAAAYDHFTGGGKLGKIVLTFN
ncbi:zinc-binding dehydrogenase [Patulibacter sp.]|uniref:alcohol dehydrogenase catalytic domain-containing protein n=1 Tax=Patulibacter sp. TaxID=1912859 RepID=UPI002728EE85|nr:zinc-binding dehydrogenase [Patulibacter sp.]MDO9407584.1 zinc-binding dehydrogenase [Patulibacter sp.]